MLPDESLSSTDIPGILLYPDNLVTSPLQDYELGGVALNDPSQGLQVQLWTAFVDGDDIMIQATDGDPEVLITAPGTDEVALTFDSNMRPALAYRQAGLCKFRWYDTLVADQVVTEYPDADSLRVALDDKRSTQSTSRDIILAYTRAEGLYFRAQRDRYLVEYTLDATIGPGRLLRLGMSTVNRVQFEFVAGADPDSPVFPRTDNKWLVPGDSGFGEGELVGIWAEGLGFIDFRQIEREGDNLLLTVDMPGTVDQDRPTELIIGYPYSARFVPLPFAEPDNRGPLLGRKRRLIRALFSVQDAGQLLVNNQPLLPQVGEGQSDELTSRTGHYEVRMLGWTAEDRLEVEAVSPYHAIIRAMLREYNAR